MGIVKSGKELSDKQLGKLRKDKLKNRYLNEGAKSLTPAELLELLFYYSEPLEEAQELAEGLIERLGSFHDVFDANTDLLGNFHLSDNSLMLLKIIPELSRKCIVAEAEDNDKFRKVELLRIIMGHFIGRTKEHIVAILLDNSKNVICCKTVASGTSDIVSIKSQDLISLAITYSAKFIILAHNHTCGVPVPSEQDFNATYRLVDMLESVGIKLLDHVVVADTDYTSILDYF